ncbi:MAG: FG-GAP-like repeat-containing protein [Bacteroidota bacterium]
MNIKATFLLLAALLLANLSSNAQYCTPSNGGCLSPEITQVTFNTLNASNVCAGTNGYNYYSPSGASTTTLTPGNTYTLTVSVAATAIGSVWIDFNSDQVLDASEWTQLGTSFSPSASVNITVPSNAVNALTRMRIRTRATSNNNGSTDACTTFGSGETEDYDITIGTPVPPPVLGPLPTITSISPIIGPIGTLDTIYGTNFNTTAANNTVTYGSVNANIVSALANRLVVNVPQGIVNRPITVNTNGLTAFYQNAFLPTFTNAAPINNSTSFTIQTQLSTSNFFYKVLPIDLDEDGKMDLAALNNNGQLYLFKNIGNTASLSGSSFAPPLVIAVSVYAQNLFVADADGNGKLDFVLTNPGISSFSVIRNLIPKNTTVYSTAMLSGRYDYTINAPYFFDASDLDGDGKADFVFSNYSNYTVSVLRNTGYPGTVLFAPTITYSTGSSPYGMAIADIDNDGKKEIITANLSSNNLSIFKNNCTSGTIAFGTAVSIPTASSPYDIDVADFDGDGKTDIVVVNQNINSISIFKNSGSTASLSTASFNTRVDYATIGSGSPSNVRVGELNGDGKPDIVVVYNNASYFSVWQNNFTLGSINSLSLQTRVDVSTLNFAGATPAICDLDNDNRSDLTFVSPSNTSGITFFKNQIGVFRVNTLSTTVFNAGASISIPFTSTLTINPGNIFTAQLSDSSGSFASPVNLGSIIGTSSNTITGTIPGNAIPGLNYRIRIISTSPGFISDVSAAVRIIIPASITSISPRVASPGAQITITGTNFSPILAENIVYFGAQKAIVTGATTTTLTATVPVSATEANVSVTVLANIAYSSQHFSPTFVGNGIINSSTLGASTSFSLGTSPLTVEACDITNDGKPDIIVPINGPSNPSNNIFLKNTATAGIINVSSFAGGTAQATAGTAWASQMVDLDGDGLKDLLTVNNNVSTLSVQKNTTTGNAVSFGTRFDLTIASSGTGIAYTDIDGDGKTDIASANFSTNNVSIFRNIGSGGVLNTSSFASRIDQTVGSGPVFIAFKDIDGDKKQDMVVINNTANTIFIYKNTSTAGSISFATASSFATQVSPRVLTFTDLNADGKVEILVTNQTSNSVSIFENTSIVGTISLATRVDLTTGNGPWGVAAGDIDGNGKPDIAVANFTAGTVSLFANNYTSGTITSASFATRVDGALGTSTQPTNIAICDIDGNLKPEIIATLYGNGTVAVFPNNTPTLAIGSAPSQVCSGSTVAIPYTATLTFNPGNIFSIQLSDENGSFASPISIGSAIATTSGTINAIIPTGLNVSSNYLIRVISTSPAVISASSANTITLNNCPTITSISPLSGDIGTTVTINGSNFSTTLNNNIVYFGAVKATVTAATATSITATNPFGNNYKSISVTNLSNNLTASYNKPFNTTFAGASATFSSNNFSIPFVGISGNTQPLSMATGDLDNDGKTDMVSCGNNNSVSIYRNFYSIGNINVSAFPSRTDINLTNTSNFVKVADMDGDGKLDVMVFTNSGLSILKNTTTATGNITFATVIDITTPAALYSGCIADLDNDGKPEIIATTSTNIMYVFKNATAQGNIIQSSFTRADITVSSGGYFCTPADFDNDGKMDIALTFGSSAFNILRNTGAVIGSSLFTTISLSNGTSSYFIAANDFDNDGKTDIAIANYSSSFITVYRNNYTSGNLTAGSFTSQAAPITNSGSYGLVAMDIDGDNKIDLVNSSQSGYLSVLRNVSTSTIAFNSAYTVSSTTGTLVGTEVGDFNNDGKIDIAATGYGNNNVYIWQNTTPTFSVGSVGTSSFCSGSSVTIPYTAPSGLFSLGNVFTAQLSDSSGSFASPANLGSVISTSSGTINGTLPNSLFSSSNYRIRIVSSNPSSISTNYTLINVIACPNITSFSPLAAGVGTTVTINGNNFSTTAANNIVYFGSVKATVTSASSSQLQVTVPGGAINNQISLTVGNFTTLSALLFTPTFTGNGTITTASLATRADIITGLNGVRGATLADFDNDGKPDMYVANSGANNINVYRNLASPGPITTSSFTSAITLAATNQPWFQAVADFDNDGKLDIATVNLSSNTVSVFRNTTTAVGTITFATKIDFTLPASASPYGIATGDIDGDGLIDMAVANLNTNSVSLFKNNSVSNSINFASAVNFTTLTQPSSIIVAEIDGDGKPDIAVTNFGSNQISVFRNIAAVGTINTSSLASRNDFTCGNGPFYMSDADIDGDGKIDLVVPNYTGNNMTVLRNTSAIGSVNFSSSNFSTAGASGINAIGMGDIDGDGKVDITTANNSTNNITLYKNNSVSGIISLGTGINFATPNGVVSTFICDIDGDNRPDILTSNNTANNISVFRNSILAPEPTVQATTVTTSLITNTSITVNWTNGNGSRRIVVARIINPVTSNPVDETNYTANTSYGSGSQVGSANFVVYNGTGTSVTVTGLALFTQYHFSVFEYNGTGGSVNYLTPTTATTNATTLPVTLVDFKAEKIGDDALLTWSTSTEINNNYFEVQRAEDNKNWIALGQVKGNGNATSLSKYKFTDKLSTINPASKTIYYRLKQVDFDGKFEILPTRVIQLNDEAATLEMYPNPAKDYVTLQVSGATEWQYKVYNTNGTVVLANEVTNNNTTQVDMNSLPKGIYFVKVEMNKQVFVKKLVVE